MEGDAGPKDNLLLFGLVLLCFAKWEKITFFVLLE